MDAKASEDGGKISKIVEDLRKLRIQKAEKDPAVILRKFGTQEPNWIPDTPIFLGSYDCAQNLDLLKALGITHVLTVANRLHPKFREVFSEKNSRFSRNTLK